MRVFDGSWSISDGHVRLELTPGECLEIEVSGGASVRLSGVREDEEVLLHQAEEFKVRIAETGFQEAHLICSDPFAYRCKAVRVQDGEPLNNENPPDPPLPGADNLVAQFHRLVKENARRDAAPYLDPEDLPFGNRYVVDEENEDFEEEVVFKFEARKKAETEEASEEEPDPAAAAAEPPPDGDEAQSVG